MKHDNAAKDWSALGAWALFPSDITYKPKINNRKLQGGRSGAGARQKIEIVDGSLDTVRGTRGGSVKSVNREVILTGIMGWPRG